jgi:uncharacterized protein YbcV (DUF1398 family)
MKGKTEMTAELTMNTEVIHNALAGSLAGTLTFPEVVQALLGVGVESYRADLVLREKTTYMPGGQTHREPMDIPVTHPAAEFSTEGVVTAIRAIQAKQIQYREFLDRILAAGTTDYAVYLNGKRAIYFGRKGEFHVEEFPRAK